MVVEVDINAEQTGLLFSETKPAYEVSVRQMGPEDGNRWVATVPVRKDICAVGETREIALKGIDHKIKAELHRCFVAGRYGK